MPDIHTFEPLWGEWYLVKRIGQGSFGVVYLAEKSELGKKYYSAIKHIRIPIDDHSSDDLYNETDETRRQYYDDMLKTLMQEIDINYQLKGNANIVSYEEHKVFPRENEPGYDVFIKMELLTSLTDYIKTDSVTVGNVVRLGEDICTALTVLQQARIVHRDIKPGNIFVHSSGHYKLGDFGVARTLERTMSSMSVKGTIAYMSPEVRKGSDGDYRVDVYSLGLVLFRLLNGNRAPFAPLPPEGITYNCDMRAHRRRLQGDDLPPPFMADEKLAAIIRKACAYRAEDRYLDASHFRSALVEYEASVSPRLLESVVLPFPDLYKTVNLVSTEGKGAAEDEKTSGSRDGTGSKNAAGGENVTEGKNSLGGENAAESENFTEDEDAPGSKTSIEDESSTGDKNGIEWDKPPGGDETIALVPPARDQAAVLQSKPKEEYRPLENAPDPPTEINPELLPDRREKILRGLRQVWGKKRMLIIGVASIVIVALILVIALLPKNSDTASTPAPTPAESLEPSPPAAPTVTPAKEPVVVLADEGLEGYIRQLLELSPEEELTPEMLEQIDELRIGADSGFTIRSLEDLSALPNLKILDIREQQPDNLEPITKLDKLTNLNLGGYDLENDEVLDRLPKNIQNLALNDTGLSSLQFVSRLEQLRYLNISGNSIFDLSPLASLTHLSNLVADGNPISDWSGVESIQDVSGRPEAQPEEPLDTPSPSVVPTATPRQTASPTQTAAPRPTSAPVPTPTPTPTPAPAPASVSGISLSQGSAVLDVGGGFSLYATVYPANATNAAVSWYSSNPGVAVVGGGWVTAVGSGTAVITASCGGYSASCVVSVS